MAVLQDAQGSERNSWLTWMLKGFLLLAVAVGGLSYVIHYISTLIPNPTTATPSPLELAGTSGAIGGLLLVGAFAKQGNEFEAKLRRTGKFFLGAAAYLTICFLLLEWARVTNPPALNFWQQAMTWIGAAAIVMGIYHLARALVDLVSLLPEL